MKNALLLLLLALAAATTITTAQMDDFDWSDSESSSGSGSDSDSESSSEDEEAGRATKGRGKSGKKTMSVTKKSPKKSEEMQYAYFQCTARYVERDGKTLVTRVYTHQLPIAQDVEDFLESVDDEVIPVVLGREAVYR